MPVQGGYTLGELQFILCRGAEPAGASIENQVQAGEIPMAFQMAQNTEISVV
jgi:hypothetical protein